MNKFSYFLLLKNALTHLFYKTSFIFLLLLGVSFIISAQQPVGFQDNEFQAGFDQANGITFGLCVGKRWKS
jgi:hypothetical protein